MSKANARRWEYAVFRPPRGETKKEAENPEDELNEYGADGWELAETIDYSGGGTKYLVFKRPASPDAGEGDGA
ncbi:DUF4177 domain-containing protein [Halobacterium zhouii]|uniref:DUF4177 domain-containing protein n=1 Tax=Halobacterium zhouii TaxID=2902624 RepID=UPI001E383F3D|nr:DUF4177 domain-containing protein [Halobacterium zhouii]